MSFTRPSYQVALINAEAATQNILTNKQATSATAGSQASALLDAEYTASQSVLEADQADINAITDAGQAGGWTDEETEQFNAANQVYQNDTLVSQIGQNNANSAVQTLQTQVGQDGSNLSNTLSLSSILTEVGKFMIGILANVYQ